MLATTNPLAQLKPDQRPQWFKMHTELQSREACKQWLDSLTLTDLFDKHLPPSVYVYLTKLLLGDHKEKIRASNKHFDIEVLEDVKLGKGFSDYGERLYDVYEKGQYQRVGPREAISLFIKFGPSAINDSNRGKVVELKKQKRKTKKVDE